MDIPAKQEILLHSMTEIEFDEVMDSIFYHS